MKGLEIIAATADNGEDAGDGEYSSTKFGGKWKAGPHSVAVQVENADNDGTDVDTTYVDYNFKMGKNVFDVAIGSTDVDGGSETDFTRFAVTHKFSKKTKAWIGNRTTENDDADTKVSVTSVGLQVRF